MTSQKSDLQLPIDLDLGFRFQHTYFGAARWNHTLPSCFILPSFCSFLASFPTSFHLISLASIHSMMVDAKTKSGPHCLVSDLKKQYSLCKCSHTLPQVQCWLQGIPVCCCWSHWVSPLPSWVFIMNVSFYLTMELFSHLLMWLWLVALIRIMTNLHSWCRDCWEIFLDLCNSFLCCVSFLWLL